MKRITVLTAAAAGGMVLGAAMVLGIQAVVVDSSTLHDEFPRPLQCTPVAPSDLRSDPRYQDDSALRQVLSDLPEERVFWRCQ